MRGCLLSRLWCLLILSLGSAPAAAGVTLESVSLRAGGSYSAFEGSFHDAVDGYVVGFTAAGGVGLSLGPVPIQAELWVIRKGGRMGSLTFSDPTFGGFTFPAQRWLVSYVEAPLLAKLESGGGRRASIASSSRRGGWRYSSMSRPKELTSRDVGRPSS